MDRDKNLFHVSFNLPGSKLSGQEVSELFKSAGVSEIRNSHLTSRNLKSIIDICSTLKKLHLPGCASVKDKLFVQICPNRNVQKNLRSLNIYGTSVSAAMAVCIFYSLPNLERFVYHDISGFLHYAGVNISKPDRRGKLRKHINKLQLGLVHDAAIHLKYSNCDTDTWRGLKEIELYLPAKITEESRHDIFQFERKRHGLFEFADIYKVLLAVQPEKIFGSHSGIHLTEMSFFSVKNIDLDKTFSTSKYLKMMLFHSSQIKTSYKMEEMHPRIALPNRDYRISKSLRALYLCNMADVDVVRIVKHCPNLKELNLYDMKLTDHMFYCVNNSIKVSMTNCRGCYLSQAFYMLRLPQYIAHLLEYFTHDDRSPFSRFFIVCMVIILFIYLFIFIWKLYMR